ncbi:response regulator transcription factor [Melioribacteraceae bacterium 4301-Me]|uniref:response regulator transcription factor n=1 Tax=Pyranulibacter aquaticus TaxID=3163344 RepID=UPI0035979851
MRILILEDEPGIANFIRDGLTEEGFAVDVADNGKSGLETFLANEYDLVLIDWMIPGLSGIEVCRTIRNHNYSTPIIFITAKNTVDDTIFGLEAGANDYIKKPFAFEELLARIRVQLRNNPNELKTLSFQDLLLNLDTHSVFIGNKEIHLTQKEFTLLEYLMRNKGKVCTRTRIIEHVWDIHFKYDTSVIDVYINSLRKKLAGDTGKNYIHTIRGVGYILREE